jgi:hypothetical protein
VLESRVSAEKIKVVHGWDDDSTRNNLITLAYHQLSEDLVRFTRSESANWCCWAKWTSKTIGVGIRWGEVRDLAKQRVEARQDSILNRWAASRAVGYFFMGGLLRALTSATRLAGRPLADGNRDVFYEVGMSVVGLIEAFGDEEVLDAAALEEHLAATVAVAPSGSLVDAPLDDMRAAMRCFAMARFAPDDSVRDQRVLAANIHLAAYEQARLQQVVTSSLDAPVDSVFRPITWIGRHLPTPVRRVVGLPPRFVRRVLRRFAVRVATRFVLVVVTKDEVVRLGRPMRPAIGSTVVFPSPYDHPTCSYLREACDSLMGPVDLSRPLAKVWTEYPQRVHFTAVLFRSRHLHPSLREEPMDLVEMEVVEAELREPRTDDGSAPPLEGPGSAMLA